MKFIDLGLCPEILEGVADLGFETPTPVQAEVIPYLLDKHRDLLALAQTGTGKTAAFGLPLLEMLDQELATPQALILCPTRELCKQITRDLQSFARHLSNVKILAVYGGAEIYPQLKALSRGVQIVVATPGRMLDIIRRKRVDLTSISRLVLDEADEMLNMGFEEDLEGVLASVPDGAQTLLLSATMPKQVEKIAGKYMHKPHQITLGSRNAGAENVSHEFYVVHAKDRYRALRRIIDAYPNIYGIVFCRTRAETQQVADQLRRDGYNTEALHGDLSQSQRDGVMKKFRDHQVKILVATDVAARGLDVNDITHVLNYNLPDNLNSYTHRSGRTGRAGKEGISVSIIHMREHFKIDRIQKAMGKSFVRKGVPTGEEIARIRLTNKAELVRNMDIGPGLIDKHLEQLNAILSDLSREELIRRLISSDMRDMLLFYRDAPDINVSSPNPPRRNAKHGADAPDGARGGKRANRKNAKSGEGMTELVMNVGKINGVTPKKLISMINVADRESSIEVGRINIVKMQSYFQVPGPDAQQLMASFESSIVDCKGRQVSVAMADNSPKKRMGGKRSKKYANKSRRK